MANEITASIMLRVRNGTYPPEYLRQIVNRQFTQTGSNSAGGVQTIGTSHEAFGVTDVGTAGWALFHNTDSTNYVELGALDGSSNFIAFAKLKAGEFAIMRLGTNAPYGKANTASCKVEYQIFSD